MSLHRSRALSVVALLCLIQGMACAGRPPAPAPGTGTLTGHLDVRPPAADAVRDASGSAYGDRRLRDAKRVDYSRPGFAIVYLDLADVQTDATEAARETVRLTLRDAPTGLRIDPTQLAVRTGSLLSIRNQSADPHVVSLPELGRIVPLATGEAVTLAVDDSGDHTIHVIDRPGTNVRLFVAPGPFARVSDSGRFVLADLPPGTWRVNVWHPRLPPTSALVDLRPDRIEEVRLSLGSGGIDDD